MLSHRITRFGDTEQWKSIDQTKPTQIVSFKTWYLSTQAIKF